MKKKNESVAYTPPGLVQFDEKKMKKNETVAYTPPPGPGRIQRNEKKNFGEKKVVILSYICK